MKSNILLVGLDYEFIKILALKLADYFDMHYLDVQDLIEYSLMDKENIKVKCGIEYLEKEEQKIARSVQSYENTIINFPYSLYLKNSNHIYLQDTAITIFIKINNTYLYNLNSKKDLINQLTLEIITQNELNQVLENKTNINIDIKNLNENECVKQIIEKLKETLLKMGNL